MLARRMAGRPGYADRARGSPVGTARSRQGTSFDEIIPKGDAPEYEPAAAAYSPLNTRCRRGFSQRNIALDLPDESLPRNRLKI